MPAQGRKVLEMLETAFARNEEKTDPGDKNSGPNLYVISPFHTVAEGMRQLLSVSLNGQYPALAANRELVENWIMDEQNPHIGTVHTFQGREADEVIFLLGCDGHSRMSANWVSRNIVNVAVSRARYRLYVVGDIKVWNACNPVMEMKHDLDSYAFDRLSDFAGAVGKADGQTETRVIPELPSSEMFAIESTEPSGEEYIIDTDAALENIMTYVPGLSADFSSYQLQLFGMKSMEEFRMRFSPGVQSLLRTGIWNYLWIRPEAEKLPEYFDASTVAICFCKAFELYLKENYYQGMKMLVPEAVVRGKAFTTLNPSNMMIGDFAGIISTKQNELGFKMSALGHDEMDADWWGAFLEKLSQCKACRNQCCHPGQVYTWNQLEYLLGLLFKESRIGHKIIPGLMLDTAFRDIIMVLLKNDLSISITDLNTHSQLVQKADHQENCILKQYIRVTKRIKSCLADHAPLEQKVYDVRKKDGTQKRMQFQYCRKCGRCYLNVKALSNTICIDEYNLMDIPLWQWK